MIKFINYLAIFIILSLGLLALTLLQQLEIQSLGYSSGLATIGLIGVWRWSWLGLQIIRSRIYLYRVFPRWRSVVKSMPTENLPPICCVIPTYREKPEITQQVFQAIAAESLSLIHPLILVIIGTIEDHKLINTIIQQSHSNLRVTQVLDSGKGKRQALADGLRELSKLHLNENTIITLMDGDTVLTSGTLKHCLPFFQIFPKLGALTTDEIPIVSGSYLFSEWLNLRFSQRHLYMCSHALSRKLLCLTGRFSLFRSQAALHPGFISILENDTLEDWLWGKFKFLSGDDKSTWYWLLKNRAEMIYVPDVSVYTIETISGSVTHRAYQNMRRWFGNMLRNGNRALALSPLRTSWFIWCCLLDQRISIWTSLLAPGLLLVYLVQLDLIAVGIILLWLIITRCIFLAVLFWNRKTPIKLIHIPILLISQWSSSLIKIFTQMNLAQQKWSNRGNQSSSIEGKGWVRGMKKFTSYFLLATQMFSFSLILIWLSGQLNLIQDIASWRLHYQIIPSSAAVASTPLWTDNLSKPNWKQHWGIRDRGSWGWQNLEVLPDPSGRFSHFIRVHYPSGSASPTVARTHQAPLGGVQFYATLQMPPQNNLQFSYYVRFSENYNFVKGGKLPGLFGGKINSGGQIPDGTNGFSTRYMWRDNGEGEIYVYLPISIEYGTSMGRGTWRFQPGRWYHLDQQIVLNNLESKDGLIKVWVDNLLVFEKRELTFRTTEELKIEGIFFSTFFGGGDPSWATPKDVYADFAEFSVTPF
ncbi:glycosyltransferase [Oscillatoria laete-virens NRMC-F 0139]|nr:glycosyltransferase [Oscillatoria laete-virens]MDL5052085.1 glycosyltransferase [Oscillatoria laete-virens NRMC-F 0139]